MEVIEKLGRMDSLDLEFKLSERETRVRGDDGCLGR